MDKTYERISQHQKEDFDGTHKELLAARREELRLMPGGCGSRRKYKEFLITGKIKKRK
jgi:hypothetical protein